uniref:ADP-ribosylation factor-like 13A n=1 Tax=Hucho hucho TaxID=62062 RepID=A0A4W5KBH2_9TELE
MSSSFRWELRRRWWPLCSPCSVSPQLMTNCCSWVSTKVNALVVGLDKAGKHPLAPGWMRGPTHGCVRMELRVQNFLVTLLDIGGATEVRGSWRDLYGEVHGLIFVVDSSDRAFNVVFPFLNQLIKCFALLLCFRLASKQDKMNALLGIEIIEILSLERLVNQSRCLYHIKPCSVFMDQLRRTDRKTLWGLCWLLHAVNLDYPELCSCIIRNIRDRRPLAPDEGQPREDGEAAASPKRKGKRETITLCLQLDSQKKYLSGSMPALPATPSQPRSITSHLKFMDYNWSFHRLLKDNLKRPDGTFFLVARCVGITKPIHP